MTGAEQVALQAYAFVVLLALALATIVLIVVVRRKSTCRHPLSVPMVNGYGHRAGYRCSRCGERLPTILRSVR